MYRKPGHGSLKSAVNLDVWCAHEGETGMDESVHVSVDKEDSP